MVYTAAWKASDGRLVLVEVDGPKCYAIAKKMAAKIDARMAWRAALNEAKNAGRTKDTRAD